MLFWARKPGSQAGAEIGRNFVHSGTRARADQQLLDPPLGVPETELFMFKADRRFEGLKAQGMKVPASDLHMPQFFQENPRQLLF